MGQPATKQARDKKDLEVPSPPHTLAAVVRKASDPEVSQPELAQLVSADPGFTVQLLQIVNSSMYNRGAKITSVSRAVAVLGSRSLRNIALCIAAQSCAGVKIENFDVARFWEDSVRRAVAAQLLAERLPARKIDPMEAFTGALLQDLGVVALVQSVRESAGAWMEIAGESHEDRRRREKELFGQSHDEIAASVNEVWGLPDELAAVMQYHHEPDRAPFSARALCEIARGAEVLAGVLSCDDKRRALARAREVLTDELAIDADKIDEIIDQLSLRVSDAAKALGIKVRAQPTLQSVLVEANKGLVALNLSYEELVRKLERTIEEKERLGLELAERTRELEQLSVTDSLSGLPNRRAFTGRLSYEVQRSARGGDPVVLLLLDVDHFKSINDTWGHGFGDEVLKAISVAIGDVVRSTDMAARIGGEEFAVILPATPPEGGLIAARKLLEAVSSRVMRTPTGEDKKFTISIGQAHLLGPFTGAFECDEVAARLYQSSDSALYASKHGGRNRVTRIGEPIAWLPP